MNRSLPPALGKRLPWRPLGSQHTRAFPGCDPCGDRTPNYCSCVRPWVGPAVCCCTECDSPRADELTSLCSSHSVCSASTSQLRAMSSSIRLVAREEFLTH